MPRVTTGRVAGSAAAVGIVTSRGGDAMDIVWLGFRTHQYDRLACLGSLDTPRCVEVQLPGGRARRGARTPGDQRGPNLVRFDVRFELGHHQLSNVFRVHLQ